MACVKCHIKCCKLCLCAVNLCSVILLLHRVVIRSWKVKMNHPGSSTSNIEGVNRGIKRKYKVKVFQKSWLEIDNFKEWLTPHSDGVKAYCTACKIVLVCGKSELNKHASGKFHKLKINKIKEINSNNDPNSTDVQGTSTVHPEDNLRTFPRRTSSGNLVLSGESSASLLTAPKTISHVDKVKTAEIKIAAFVAEHNIAIRTVDHLIPLLKDIYLQPEVVQDLSLSRTKCTKIIQNVVAKRENETTVNILKRLKFSILLDESTSVSNDKILCILVKYVAPDIKKSITELLELVKLDARNCSAEMIYSAFKCCLGKYEIPLTNIVGMACDNASVMTGIHESFFTKLKKEVPSLLTLLSMNEYT